MTHYATSTQVLVISVPELRQHCAALESDGFTLSWADTSDEALKQLAAGEPAISESAIRGPAIIILPTTIAIHDHFCERLAKEFPAIEMILVHEAVDKHDTADLMEEADIDYLNGVDDPSLVASRLRRALRHRTRRLELLRLRKAIARDRGYESMLGTSPQMQAVFELVDRAASTNASVLITGESGTGKELVARALHNCGLRKDQPFVAINCSAVPESLLESELFGHVKGAFTDARDSRAGLFAKANGGTLFLDEIGDMPLPLQPKLLRALQERTIRPVGGDKEISIDVRVVAATNRDLEAASEGRLFREDLFYRLNVIHIEVPPLRERASDILLLAESLARSSARESEKEFAGISRPAAALLLRYGWPGNVRELQNCMERATALREDEFMRVVDLPEALRSPVPAQAAMLPTDQNELVRLDVVERRYIEHVLKALDGNKKAAAGVLGLDRKTLYRKLDRYRLASDESPAIPKST